MQEELSHYLALWQLTNPSLIAETFTSHVYKVERDGETLALKLLTPDGAHDEVGGAVALAHFGGKGAVQIYEYDAGAHLLEYVAGEDLIPMVEAGQDEAATRISASVIQELQQQSGKAPQIRSLKRWFAALFEQAKADELAGIESIYRRAAPLAQALLDNPREELVLHADIHHANIRLHPQRGYLAFDPKGIYGERTYEAANMLYNPNHALASDESRLFKTAEILSTALNLDYERYLQFAFVYGCLSAAWWLEGAGDPNPTLAVAELIEARLQK